jgi:NAD(P)-dependent dehydrogenase (short-subunit alcohol dehydrogenase family)
MLASNMGIAIVTGAASGMGRSASEALVKEGWDVLALDRVATEFEVAGETIRTVEVDVTNRDQVREAIAEHVAMEELSSTSPPSTRSRSLPASFSTALPRQPSSC